MTAHSARQSTVRKSVYLILVVLLLVANSCAAGGEPSQVQALQALAVRIRHAVDQTDAGSPPVATSVAQLEHALSSFRDESATSADAHFQRKYQAVALLFGKLKYQLSHRAQTLAKPNQLTRAQLDIEIVSARHGATCENALGISEALPVKLTLAQSGLAQSDAWFRFAPGSTGNFRLKTDSSGADPALTVTNGCGAGAEVVGSNDDVMGLDAELIVSASDRQPVFIHLTNSGTAGGVVISAAATIGSVNGVVKDARTGLAIANAQVSLYDLNGNLAVYNYTDQGGNYSVSPATAGTYYVRADAPFYVSELFPAATCQPGGYYYGIGSCNTSQAHTVTVSSSAVSNINFSLGNGQKILGQVRSTSNQPLYASVFLLDGSGNELESISSDTAGHYSFSTLPAGNYKVEASATGYGTQMYNDVACGGALQNQCDFSEATSLAVGSQDVSGVNFGLPFLSVITGSVTTKNSAAVPAPQITVLDVTGNYVASATGDNSGNFSVGPLANGNYYVYATATGFFSQLYSSVDCAADCGQSMAGGEPIVITYTGQQAQADFQLDPLPTVTGHVQDATSGSPLGNVTISVSSTPPAVYSYPIYSAQTDANGDYALADIPAGKFYVWALSNDHVDQIYSGIACEAIASGYPYPFANCDVSGATLLVIAPGQNPGPFDFSLGLSAGISGNALTRAGAGSDLPASVDVIVYDGSGTNVASALPDASGNYVINDLGPGTYYVAAQSYNQQYVEQIWQQSDCTNTCAPTTGTPVLLAYGADVAGIDFQMTRSNAIVGRVTDEGGNPINGAVVDLFNTNDKSYFSSGIADAQGYYAATAYVGSSYFMATEAGSAYVDQVYAGISCRGPAYYGQCSLAGATPMGLSGSGTQPHIVNFMLQPNDRVFANGFE